MVPTTAPAAAPLPASPAIAPTAAPRRARLLGWGTGGYHRRVNPRRLLGPRVALALILALLLRALAFRRIDDRLLGLCGAGPREDGYPKQEWQCTYHVPPPCPWIQSMSRLHQRFSSYANRC